MRGTLPLILAGTCLAILPLMGPAGHALPANMARLPVCAAAEAGVLTPARDWLGSLQGWGDSPVVLAYRNVVARSKGRAGPPGCAR
ncbi:hypothetical protein EJV46_15270 [Roseococcus sp. SYP-B2431]|uniref:hypothetical protein n=1 Tax=Roseococcus sp. SYP-B2431 TaxID=2496640 RepID=UPI00103CD225|nr:hypothetical protein [Roseococcus sp. SYP-B2431]TCH97486.1 hypothetical protein EJV46_15270 [Roseococcus sp. SYP-B2431]